MAQKDILGVKWNFHYETVFSMMQGLTKEDNFTDVTIVSGDELLDYQVHKFVLSAVSPVFKEILLNNPHEHPVIYLNGMKEQELQFLLQLIYFGRTTIYDSQVDAFFKVLEEFKLTGIKLPVRTTKRQQMPMNNIPTSSGMTNGSRNENQKRSVASSKGARYECERCDYKATQKGSLRKHQENIHEGVRHECDKCDYKATNKDNLRAHHKSVHGGVRYKCDQCDYVTGWTQHLSRHKRTKHQNMLL